MCLFTGSVADGVVKYGRVVVLFLLSQQLFLLRLLLVLHYSLCQEKEIDHYLDLHSGASDTLNCP